MRAFAAALFSALLAAALFLAIDFLRRENEGAPEEPEPSPIVLEPLPADLIRPMLVSYAIQPTPEPPPLCEVRVIEAVIIPANAPIVPDEAEVDMLARMLWGEARGVESNTEKAACVWAVFNRVDDPRFPDSIAAVLEQPSQFNGYNPDYPATAELRAIAADVWTRYHRERSGDADAGRVLPREYVYFTGDGEHNYFTVEWDEEARPWGWSLESPYDN